MYIVIEIQTNTDGSIGTIVNSYEDQRDAESKYHTILSYAAKSQLPMHSAVILTNDGMGYASQCYTHGENENE